MLFPDEIKDATAAVDHRIRWQIVELLQEVEKLAYTELLNKLRIKKGSLNHHLTKLMEAGIIDNYAEGAFRGPYKSYYRLSAFGEGFLGGLLSSTEVSLPIENNRSIVNHVGLLNDSATTQADRIGYVSVVNDLQSLYSFKIQNQMKSLFDFKDSENRKYLPASILTMKNKKR